MTERFFKAGESVWLEGDIEFDDYNVRVSSMATLINDQQAKKEQVACVVDTIDGDHNVTVYVDTDIMKPLCVLEGV